MDINRFTEKAQEAIRSAQSPTGSAKPIFSSVISRAATCCSWILAKP